jgi:hypothetical protein
MPDKQEQVTLEHHLEVQVTEVRRELEHQIEVLREEIKDASATPWPMVAIIVALALAVITGFGGLFLSKFDDTGKRIEEVKIEVKQLGNEFVRRGELLATKVEMDTEIKNTGNRISEIIQSVAIINSELIHRRAEFVEKVELNALEKRLDERNKTQDQRIEASLPRAAWEAWRPERDAVITQMSNRIDRLDKEMRAK